MSSASDNRRKDDVRIEALNARMEALERGLKTNTDITQANSTVIQAVKANTDEIVEFFQAGKGFFIVVRSVGTIAKWIAYIAAAFGIAWGMAKFGVSQVIADLKPK